MNDTNVVTNLGTLDIPGLNLLPEKWRGWALVIVALSPFIGRAYYALRAGGGIKGVVSAIWVGTNTSKPTEPPTPINQ
jgi:hypothetical protein